SAQAFSPPPDRYAASRLGRRSLASAGDRLFLYRPSTLRGLCPTLAAGAPSPATCARRSGCRLGSRAAPFQVIGRCPFLTGLGGGARSERLLERPGPLLGLQFQLLANLLGAQAPRVLPQKSDDLVAPLLDVPGRTPGKPPAAPPGRTSRAAGD